ncbi:23S rRNA (uracil(1939)-C(5))-methyltransferase RlmD, partial [Lactobacillus paragasseri]
INGEGIGYYKKKIIFIPGALPGEVVVAKIIDRHPHYLEGELVRIKEKSPDRVAFPKGVDPAVGGLELAHLSYPKQLEFKQHLILESLRKYHPRDYIKYKVKKTISAPNAWHYRNKAQYQIEFNKGKSKLGLYAPNSRRLIDLPEMPTQTKETQKTEREIKKLIDKLHIRIADFRRHNDGIKTIVVRQSHASGEIQVTLITIGKKIRDLKLLASQIMKLPNVVSVFQNETQWQNPQVWGNKTIKLFGKSHIIEEILGKKFKLSPRAFFQLNPEQTLIDAYAGVGTLGILASDQVRQVIGIESIPEAVIDAQENCHLNHVRNAEYIQGNVEKLLPELKNQGVPIDALIVDPPRTGLSKKLIKTLLEVKPETFVYVSCNPATLAKDLVLLSEAYDVRVIQPVDMMPQTPRWEGVTKLVLRKNK